MVAFDDKYVYYFSRDKSDIDKYDPYFYDKEGYDADRDYDHNMMIMKSMENEIGYRRKSR